MSVVHTLLREELYCPSPGGCSTGMSYTQVPKATGLHRSYNPRGVPQQGLTHDHLDEFDPACTRPVPFSVQSGSIISRRPHRKPWPGRKAPRQCEVVSQLLQLCRKHPTRLSSLTAASCWDEAPFWGTHKCRWTAAQTPRCHRKSTHLSYSQFSLWRPYTTVSS